MMHPMLGDIVFCHDSSETQCSIFRNVFQGFSSLLGMKLLLHRHLGVAFLGLFLSFPPPPLLIPLIRNSFSVSIYNC